jgi:glucokinase
MEKLHVIGIDIGGTNIRIGLMDLKANLKKVVNIPTQKEKGVKDVLRRLFLSIDGITINNKVKIKGIGIGCPGPLDDKKGIIISPPNLPDWHGLKLKKIVETKYKCEVAVENDANCAAMGEFVKGAGKPYNNIVLLTLGTGVGSGVIIDKKLLRGGGFAAELGHVSLNPKGPKCGCGKKGCLEAYASATAMVKKGRRVFKGKEVTAKFLFSAAKKGNKKAKAIVDEAVYYLAVAIGNYANAFNPEAIILSGGMIKAGSYLFDNIKKQLKDQALAVVLKDLKIISAKLGEDAGVIGAGWLVV